MSAQRPKLSLVVNHDPEKTCPNRANHTPHPTGYLAHGEWAEEMLAKGYRQVKCSECGLYAIWLRRVGGT